MPKRFKCGVDHVAVSRIQEFVDQSTLEDLKGIFSQQELDYAEKSKNRYGRLAARFAAKEACVKLFPQETAMGSIDLSDFSVQNDGYGAPHIILSSRASTILDLHGLEDVSISLSHTKGYAMAMAIATGKEFKAPLIGKLTYWLLPNKRKAVIANLEKIYIKTLTREEIKSKAQEHYARMVRALIGFIHFQFLSETKRTNKLRVENEELMITALKKGRGAIILTSQFGNFATCVAASLTNFPEPKGLFCFVRRPVTPAWIETLINKKIARAGIKKLTKIISMESIMSSLEAGEAIVLTFAYHPNSKNSSQADFTGHTIATVRNLAQIALASGSPVIPATCWIEENGNHVLSFMKPLQLLKATSAGEEIRLNTRLFNTSMKQMLLRHPAQW